MKISIICIYAFIASFLLNSAVFAETITEIKPLPDVTITTPENKSFIEYLGLDREPGTPFTLSDIDADILMIELFSMYCPYCQKAAPNVNELYDLMEKNKRPDLKLVLIGIGVKNTILEVETFRQEYSIAFPLFSDSDLSIYKKLEGAGTPTFIAIKKDGDKKLIFYKKAGSFSDPQDFFKNLLEISGLK